MSYILWLLLLQGVLGAFDTVYYHEYRARLPAGGQRTRPELLVHALRDAIYAAIFMTLPFVVWGGFLSLLLAVMLAAEIVLTMSDFVIETWARRPLDVFAGERVTHGLMAIIYGAVLALLVPEMLSWWSFETGFRLHSEAGLLSIRWILFAMGVGVLASGIRDILAAFGPRWAGWPWQR